LYATSCALRQTHVRNLRSAGSVNGGDIQLKCIIRASSVLISAIVLCACGAKAPSHDDAGKAEIGSFGLDLSAGNPEVRPGDDFFAYASGKWYETAEIPADRSSYGVFRQLADRAEQQVRELIEAAAQAKDGEGSDAMRKVGNFYASFMDEAAIESAGIKPLETYLESIRSAKDKRDIAKLFGLPGYESVIGLGIRPDMKQPDKYAVYIVQSGLGLPNRDFYLKNDEKLKDIRGKYVAYIEQLLTLAQVEQPAQKAKAIYEFERKLAEAHWTIERSRDAVARYNPYKKADLIAYAPGFEWQVFFDALGIPGREDFIVGQPSAVRDSAKLFASTPIETLRAYLAFHLVDSFAPYLSKPFESAHFAFRGQVIDGRPQLSERWKRGVALVDSTVGELVGQVYVEKHFPASSKAKMEELVAYIKKAFHQRLEELPWLSPETRTRAQEKLAAFRAKIGYPDIWKDYSALEVTRDSVVENLIRVSDWSWQRDLARMDGPVDREEWMMNPQRVNAYYNATGNEIVFPAAILQPPFFDPNADDAVNYGGIGAVIGHEIGHGFDDQGRRFAADGSLTDWWTADDAEAFTRQTSKLVDQYSSFEALPGLFVNGAFTTGENLGDLGGLNIALYAYKLSLGDKPAPVLEGLTGEQRFFLSWAQVWRAKYRDEALRTLVMSDTHSPPYFRVNGPVRNMDEWYEAFNIQPTDKLYLKPEDRVRIW
jgi:putative endopeptidase